MIKEGHLVSPDWPRIMQFKTYELRNHPDLSLNPDSVTYQLHGGVNFS